MPQVGSTREEKPELKDSVPQQANQISRIPYGSKINLQGNSPHISYLMDSTYLEINLFLSYVSKCVSDKEISGRNRRQEMDDGYRDQYNSNSKCIVNVC